MTNYNDLTIFDMIFRYARHTNKLESLIYFYTSVLDFKVLGTFENHHDYDGVFLGKEGENWHLEFTKSNKNTVSVFDEEDILVFYPTEMLQYEKILENLKKYEVPLLEPKNPYWKENGICFEDCDHYKIIISQQRIVK